MEREGNLNRYRGRLAHFSLPRTLSQLGSQQMAVFFYKHFECLHVDYLCVVFTVYVYNYDNWKPELLD